MMMEKVLAFALSGGGSRGALQLGAMYALLEHGLQPDLLTGASIGAANAAFLAVNGFTKDSLDHLAEIWRTASAANIMPSNYVWLTVRAMFGRSSNDPSRVLREFLIAHGFSPDLRFSDLKHARLVIISADLNTGKPILHGEILDEKVLDALLLSTALPPWFMPVRNQNRYLMDGAVLSHLPVEPALKLGATEIVAFDLIDPREAQAEGDGLRGFLGRLVYSVEKRQSDLELELAEARGVPVLYLALAGNAPTHVWDFQHTDELIARGYKIAQGAIESQRLSNPILAGRGE